VLPVRTREWLLLLAFPPTILLLEEGRKALLRRGSPGISPGIDAGDDSAGVRVPPLAPASEK